MHFLRFELTPEMVAAAKAGAPIRVGVDHPHYKAEITLAHVTRDSLAADLSYGADPAGRFAGNSGKNSGLRQKGPRPPQFLPPELL